MSGTSRARYLAAPAYRRIREESFRHMTRISVARPNNEQGCGQRNQHCHDRAIAKRKIDWQEQFKRSLEAFGRNGFFVLVGDRQAESLDDEFTVKADTEVSFVKLVPLVGG